jgi:hypothetical protein
VQFVIIFKCYEEEKIAMQIWIKQHKFELALLAFILMVLPPVGLFLAAERGDTSWIWVLLGVVIAGNLISLFIK